MKDEKVLNGKIKFIGNELSIIFPENFDDFQKKLVEILGLNDDLLSNFTITYNGETENTPIENANDYQKFYSYLFESNKLIEISIEKKESSNVDISKCCSMFLLYKQNIESNNSQPLNINNDIQNNNIINEKQVIENYVDGNNKNKPEIVRVELTMIAFPVCCSLCNGGPVYKILYFCKECGKVYCSNCEVQEGLKHPHALFKIQTKEQYDYCNIAGITKLEKIIDGIGSSIGSAYDSVLGFFGRARNPNEESQNQKKKQLPEPKIVSLVQLTRTYYGLENFTDQQIEEALLKSLGNIEEAAVLLASQNN